MSPGALSRNLAKQSNFGLASSVSSSKREIVMRISNPLQKFLTVGMALAVLATLPQRGMAQLSGSGTINGSVTDASGAKVPAAAITIRNVETGIERKTQTTDAGDYTAAFLPPGHYELQTAKTGFTSVLRKDLVLQVGQTLTINVGL